MRDSCYQVLTKAGYRVETAMNGDVALAKVKEVGPDIVLVDLDMPGASGLEVIDRLNEVSPETIKIVATGNASIDLEKEVIMKGRAMRCLTKPFSPEQLRFVVQKALEMKDKDKNLI